MNVPIKDTKGRKIDVVGWPEEIDKDGYMRLGGTGAQEGKLVKPDVMVFATGYTREFPFLDKSYPTLGQSNVRGIYKSDDVSLGYIGFVRPAIGE